MIVEYVRYRVGADRRAALLAAYQVAGESLRASRNCLGYDLAECDEAPGTFVLRIHWDSAAGHLEGFRKSALFPPFLAAVRPFVGDIEEMRHFSPTSLRGAR